MRFKTQLFALVLSVVVPAILAAMLAIWYVYREGQAEQESGLKEAARTYSLLVNNELLARQRILRSIANAPSLANGDLHQFYEFAKKNAPTTDTTIILIDKGGRQLLNTRVPFGTPLPTQRNSDVSELILKEGAATPLVSDVFMAPIGKRYDFIIQIPLIEQGDVQRFLVMGANASAIQAMLADQNLPPSWLGAIVDRKGTVLARSRSPETFIGKSTDPNLQKMFASSTSGVTRSVTLDGVPVKTFYHRIPASDWTVILSIPESELRRSALKGAAMFALIAAFLLALSMFIASRIGALVISRIRQLELAADALGRGEQVIYSPQGLVEVDAVGKRIAQASDQLRVSQQELEHRVSQAVAETERAQRALLQSQKMEALGRLTGGIAHEFNNLLQTLNTSLQLATRTSDPERVKTLLATCTKALKRAKTLTGQLSSFGRTQDSRLESVNLSKRIQEFRPLVENVLPASIHLVIDIADDIWPVSIDPTQFELGILNLIINAKDAMPSGGSIEVTVANETDMSTIGGLATGDYVHISVRDSGIGMSAEVMAKALDPFFTTKSIGEGTGLGLPQAYGFARQAGGALTLHSTEGKGTQVDIYLPRASVAAPGPSMELVAESEPPTVTGATLLFVEDDPLVRESVAPALENGGFFVVMAESADAALACLEAGTKVDLVFSDVVMPGSLNGIDLAKTISHRFPHVRVVLATGYSENRVVIPGVQVLAKPYDVADVLRILGKAAR